MRPRPPRFFVESSGGSVGRRGPNVGCATEIESSKASCMLTVGPGSTVGPVCRRGYAGAATLTSGGASIPRGRAAFESTCRSGIACLWPQLGHVTCRPTASTRALIFALQAEHQKRMRSSKSRIASPGGAAELGGCVGTPAGSGVRGANGPPADCGASGPAVASSE
jgi:hypothetical protein